MSDPDIFDGSTDDDTGKTGVNTDDVVQADPPTGTTPVSKDFGDMLKLIVNESGEQKYATVEAALAALPHAQQHISKLEQENAVFKEEVAKATTTDELLAEMRKTSTTTETPSVSGLDVESAAQLFDSLFEKRTEAQIQADNQRVVSQKFTELYGEKAKEMMTEKATELGVSVGFIKDIAQKSPEAALKLCGVEQETTTKASESVTTSTVNTLAAAQQEPDPAKPKSVMSGADTKDLVAAWRAAKPDTGE